MNIVTKLLTYRDQAQILHWQTTSYSEHKTLDSLYEGLSGLTDEFIEVFMGKNGRIMAQTNFNLTISNYKDMPPKELVDDMKEYLTNELPKMLKPEDTDLLNIRDEMLALANKTQYLLTLK